MAEDTMLDHLKHTRDLYLRVSQSEAAPGLRVLHQVKTTAVMIASPEYAAGFDTTTPEDVVKQRFICAPSTANETSIPLNEGKANLLFANRLYVNDIVTRIALARSSLGLTCCLYSTVAAELSAGRLVAVLPDHFGPDLTMCLGTPTKSPAARVIKVAEAIAASIPTEQPVAAP